MDRIKNILVKPNITVKQALKQMDQASKKMLFVTDHEDIILGVITDGDIRRWILKRNNLNEHVTELMTKKPILLNRGHSKEEAKKIMVSEEIECIPIVENNNKVVSALWWTDLFKNKFNGEKTKLSLPVVIMAGGQGERLSPITSVLPKPLMPMGDKTILEMIIDKFSEYGCLDFYLSVNYKSNIIKAYIDDLKLPCKVSYFQEGEPLGTAGSLYLLKSKLDRTFFINNCDTLIEADYVDILQYHKARGNKITIISSMKHFTVPYGVCEIEKGGMMKQIKEKPEFDFLTTTGLYVAEPDVLNDIPERKIYHMTDLINAYLDKKESVGVYPISEKSWLDFGQWEELQKLLKKFRV